MRDQEDQLLLEASCKDFAFRRLTPEDYHKGYIEALSFLTQVGEVSYEDFLKRYNEIFPQHQDIYKMLVIHDEHKGKVIGCGSLICEKKFIRQLGTAGHIEDIVVSEEYRGKKLGLRLIELLKELAVLNGCYKTILDCEDKNVKFYEKVSILM